MKRSLSKFDLLFIGMRLGENIIFVLFSELLTTFLQNKKIMLFLFAFI